MTYAVGWNSWPVPSGSYKTEFSAYCKGDKAAGKKEDGAERKEQVLHQLWHSVLHFFNSDPQN